MRKVVGVALSVICGMLLCLPSASAATQPLPTSEAVALNPDAWTANFTRASFLPPPSFARPAATRLDEDVFTDDTLGFTGIVATAVTVAPGRLEIENLDPVALSNVGAPALMVIDPSRPMALEGPLQPMAVPEPGSIALFAAGMLTLPFLLRRKRSA